MPDLFVPKTAGALGRFLTLAALVAGLSLASPPAAAQWDVPEVGEGVCVTCDDDGFNEDGGTFDDSGYYVPYYDDWYDSGDDTTYEEDTYYDEPTYDDTYTYDEPYYDDYGTGTYEEPYYEDDGYEEPTYEDYYYEEPTYYEPTAEELAIEATDEADALLDAGYYWDAEAKYREALALDPYLPGAWNNLAVALEQQDRYQEALEAYYEAYWLDSTDEITNDNIASLESWLGEKEIADTWEAGNDMLDSENWADAEYYFRRASELDPYDSGAYQNLAYALAMQERWGEAVEADRRALELDPYNDDLRENLFYGLDAYAWDLATQGDATGAGARYAEALEVVRGHPELEAEFEASLLEAYSMATDSPDGGPLLEAAARTLVDLDPADWENHRLLGLALFTNGNLAGAEAAYREAIWLRPDDMDLQLELSGYLYEAGDYSGAVEVYGEALASPSVTRENAAALNGLIGLSLMQSGDLDGAYEALNNGVLLEPDDAMLHSLLGEYYLRTGRFADAEAELQTALALDPGNPEIAGTLDELYRSQGATLAAPSEGGAPSAPTSGALKDAVAALGNAGAEGAGGEVTVPLEPFDRTRREPELAPGERGAESLDNRAGAQVKSIGDVFFGSSPQAASSGSSEDAAKFGAGLGFDTAGRAAEGLDTTLGANVVDLRGAGSSLDNIPQELRTPDIDRVVEQREEIKRQIAEKEKELEAIPHTSENILEIAKKKQEISQAEQELTTVSFSLRQKLDQQKTELANVEEAGPDAASSGPSAAANTKDSHR